MKPVLSIGIIFKNEIRCLERCVKSLQPLRDAVPCELVMADTGSDDGSREIAEKYADIFFDFPWINDFAVARNALIDRCSGEWYLSLDADEWLDEDIRQLVRFLTQPERWDRPLCGVMLRNYYTLDLDGESNDFLAVRMARLSTGARFTGAIHELWDLPGPIRALEHTLLHHDGYVNLSEDWNKKKRERNMALLEAELEKDPESLKTLLQCIESSQGSPGYEDYIRRAMAALKKDPQGGKYYGPPILRYAVLRAAGYHLPELEEWTDWAVRDFSDSPYINIDVAYVRFIGFAEEQDYIHAIPCGATYLKTLEDYRAGRLDLAVLVFGSFVMAVQSREDGARAILADAYFQTEQTQKARDMLLTIDRSRMKPEAVQNYMRVLLNLQAQSGEDLSWVAADLWEKIEGAGEKRGELKKAFFSASAIAFSEAHRQAEGESGFRHAYTVFLPLSGKCGLGTAAELLETDDAAKMTELLTTVGDWEELPIVALERALLSGAALPGGLCLEEMDTLAERLSHTCTRFSVLLDDAVGAMDRDLPSLLWARGMALAAVKVENWEDGESGVRTARVFAETERNFLPCYYGADFLTEENLRFLPPMHRFGWHCAKAFAAMDAGDTVAYVRCLRGGLSACGGMKPVVEYLLKQLEEERQSQAASELLALARQVRMLLAQYPPDSPATEAVRRSAVYQRVKHLIEADEPSLVPKEGSLL